MALCSANTPIRPAFVIGAQATNMASRWPVRRSSGFSSSAASAANQPPVAPRRCVRAISACGCRAKGQAFAAFDPELPFAHDTHSRKAVVQSPTGGRPHSALGPGVPGPPAGSARTSKAEPRRQWTSGALVRAKSVLGGLHHEYSLSWTPVGA
jgi:hypothetical protein